MILSSVDAVSEESGWVHLGMVGSNTHKLLPNLDPRLFGHKKFSELVKSLPDVLDVEEKSPGGNPYTLARKLPADKLLGHEDFALEILDADMEMKAADIIRELSSLPPEAQKEVADFMAFLKARHPSPQPGRARAKAQAPG